MLIFLQLQSLHSPQQVFCAPTCALGSLTTLLILCVFCVHTNVKTATNVDLSYRLDHIGHVSFQFMSTPAVPSDGHWTITVTGTADTVEQLLWTFVLHVNFPVCRKELWYWVIKNFIFTVWQSRPTYNFTANSWKCNSYCMQLFYKYFKLSVCKISSPGGDIFYPQNPWGLNCWRGWLL